MMFWNNFTRSKCCLLSGLILWSLVGDTVLATPKIKKYPRIKPTSFVTVIGGIEATNGREVIIKDINGKASYRLSIYFLRTNNQTISSIRVELVGIGDRITRSDSQYEDDLLNPDPWGHGAGQRVFVPHELCSANKADHIWGARRSFRLRRMRIDVSISEIELTGGITGILHATVAVRVIPSSSSRSRPVDFAYKEPKPCF